MQQDNTVWYQINPHYFEQIALQKGWVDQEQKYKLFDLVSYCLKHIIELGCTGLWLMPIYIRGKVNQKGKGSPYAIKEYQVDPCWGAEQDLINLIGKAHGLGLKVIGEYVPNHLAPDAIFLQNNEKGLHYVDLNGKPFFDNDWSDTVKLNASHPSVQGYTSANLIWLTQNFGFDGFRLDMAHYPLHNPTRLTAYGEGDLSFWKKILDKELFKNKIWIAEVYDDLTQNLYGYEDHARLIEEGMIAYDKKIHDILARKLKHNPPHQVTQELFYNELYHQAQIAQANELDFKKGICPFLRIPSNHDDCPGKNNFGGVNEYIAAFKFLALCPGSLMIYSGDEFGLEIKPSVTGSNVCDSLGNLHESQQVKLIDEYSQGRINSNIKNILQIRNNHKVFSEGGTLIAKITTHDSNPSCDLVAFVRYIPESKELALVATNLGKTHNEMSWGQIKTFYPTFDFPKHEFQWQELLEWINPDYAKKGYKLHELTRNETLSKLKFKDEFWIGLKPHETQVLKVLVT